MASYPGGGTMVDNDKDYAAHACRTMSCKAAHKMRAPGMGVRTGPGPATFLEHMGLASIPHPTPHKPDGTAMRSDACKK